MKKKILLRHAVLPAMLFGLMVSCSDGTELNEVPKDNPEDPVENPVEGPVTPSEDFTNELKPVELTAEGKEISNKLVDFYNAYTKYAAAYVDENEVEKNFVVSPLSASIVLSMMGNAVEGDLKQEIISCLGLNSLEGVNDFAHTLLTSLPALDKTTKMNLANAVWVNDYFKLLPDFSDVMSNVFESEISYLDLNDMNFAKDTINSWIAEKTEGKITDYITPDDLYNLKAMLMNVMNFKAVWNEEDLFDEKATEKKPFYGQNFETAVETMKSKTGLLYYISDAEMQYLALPFGNGAYWFEVVMPAEGNSIYELPEKVESHIKDLRDLKLGSNTCIGNVELPKFSLDTDLKLNNILKSAGVEHINNLAELSIFVREHEGDIDKEAWMQFRQEVVFDVNEKGAEAVAVSSNGMAGSPGPSEKLPVEVKVNKPFMFFITESSTGASLVAGRITDL